MNRNFALLGGLVTVIWGIASGWWPLAVILALALELPLLVRRRLVLDDKDYILFSKLLMLIMCLLFLVMLVNNPREGLPNFITWTPVLFGILVLMQVWSEQGNYPLRAVVCSLMRSPDYSGAAWPRAVDLRLLYFMLTLVSVSMNLPVQGRWFPLFAVLIIWLVWRNNPRRDRPWLWLGMAAGATAMSLVMVTGIDVMHRNIQQHGIQWIAEYWARINAQQTNTAIGNIGVLKLSGRIIFRVDAPPGRNLLLRRAAFSSYHDGTWSVDDHRFQPVAYDAATETWQLQKAGPSARDEVLTVSAPLRHGSAMMILPQGAYGLHIDGDVQVEANAYGAARVQYNADSLDYRVSWRAGLDGAKPPGGLDQWIPDEHREIVMQTASELGLQDLPPEQVVTRLQRFFRDNFSYSLEQRQPEPGQSFLESFLRERRAGHCEYFATSAALLLRAAGIPSRYVVGYSMSEYNETLERYIIRERHGHAWTEAWINGSWQALDYTPAGWQALDASHERWWRGLYDAVANFRYLVAGWWQRDDKGAVFNISALLIAVLLVLYLLKRMKADSLSLRWNKAQSRRHNGGPADELHFHELLQNLERHFGDRPPAQPLRSWINTLPIHDDKGTANEELQMLVEDYYRYRYGQGADAGQVEDFRRRLHAWLSGPARRIVTVPADPPG